MTIRKGRRQETLIYLALWTLLFMVPLMTAFIRSTSGNTVFNWEEIFDVWKHFAIFLAIFLVHNILIAPLLVYKQKRVLYLVACLAVVAVFQLYQCNHRPQFRERGPRREFADRGPAGNEPPGRPMDMDGRPSMPPEDRPPKPPGDRPPMPSEDRPPMKPRMERNYPPLLVGQHDLIALVILILMLGMNLGVKLYFKQREDREKMDRLAKQNLEQQLEYLKYQINPHFFMNTLNNIHALVDIDPEKAKATIVELSKMMRFVLYEGNKPRVPLEKELTFLQNYIMLMKIRYTDKVRITFRQPDTLPGKEVPPLIFITFVENAFKHGVSYRQESFIDVEFKTDGEKLFFTCCNSRVKHEDDGKPGGVGLANVRQRLELIYGSSFSLDIDDASDVYTVNLTIPI